MTERVRSSFTLQLRYGQLQDGNSNSGFRGFRITSWPNPCPYLIVELLQDGNVVASRPAAGVVDPDVTFTWTSQSKIQDLLAALYEHSPHDRDHWSFRVRGAGVIETCSDEPCWSGSYTIPLADIIQAQ